MNKKKRFSIGRKMYLFVIIIILVSTLGTAGMSHYINANQIDEYYKTIARDSARNLASFLDADYFSKLKEMAASEEYQAIRDQAEEEDNEEIIQEYIENAGLWEQYQESRAFLVNYLEHMDNIKYLYVVVWGDSNATYDMYLMDDYDNPLYETGYYELREEELLGMEALGEVEPTISHGDWGWLCSAYAPIYAEDGSIICHVGCDVEMNEIMEDRQQHLIYILIGSLLFSALISIGALLFNNRIIVTPLNSLTMEMKKFTPAENTDYETAHVVNLNIQSRDEIQDIYEEIHTMQTRIIDYLNDLSTLQKDKEKAENDIKDKEQQIGEITRTAYRDALTSVGSKIAYIEKCNLLNQKIEAGTAEFAIVMVDMNNLKKINDTYGHKAGDAYIKGCCRIICEVYKHSPVYRIGGDEFIVVLQGRDYQARLEHIYKLREIFEGTYTKEEGEPWEKYSASVGMAEYASDDSTVDFVFKRADRAMYEEKQLFKKKYGSYR